MQAIACSMGFKAKASEWRGDHLGKAASGWLRRAPLSGPICGVLIVVTALTLSGTSHSVFGQGYIGEHRPTTKPHRAVFRWGQYGGSNSPTFVAAVRNDNVAVVSRYGVQRRIPVSMYAVEGLMKLAEAESYFSMSSILPCAQPKKAIPETPPTTWITISTTRGRKTVSSTGGCQPAFVQLFDVLSAVAGV